MQSELVRDGNPLQALIVGTLLEAKQALTNSHLTRNYEYRLRMNKAFQLRAEEVLEESRQLYNAALAHRIAAYRSEKKTVTIYDQQFELTELRSEYSDYTKTNRGIQREALDRVDKAYKAFFRRVKNGETPGFPRFKNRDRYDSFALPIDSRHACPLQGDKLHVPSVGTVRVRLHRPLPEGATVKQTRIVRRSDGWYAVLAIQFLKPEVKRLKAESVGLDLGITSFATLSNGEQITNRRFLENAQDVITNRSQRLAFKPKRKSNKRATAKRLLNKAHLKVKRARKHFHCNAAKDLTQRFCLICVENLNVKGMVKSNLARVISDVGWSDFLNRLVSKAEEAGSTVVKVNPAYTSQTCSICGHCNALNRLTQAEFSCIKCGHSDHADVNAAKNIRARGAKLAEESACENTAVRVARNKRRPKRGKASLQPALA